MPPPPPCRLPPGDSALGKELEQRLADLERRLSALERDPGRPEAPELLPSKTEETVDSGLAEEFVVGQTIWDAPIIIGLPGMGHFASAILLFSLALNMGVQVFIAFAVMSSDSFVNSNAFKEQVEAAKRWRLTEGHDIASVGSAGNSLVSRVCNLDDALSVAGAQTSLLSEINAYHGLQEDQFEPHAKLGVGVCLCCVCILVHSIIILRELRNVRDTLFACIWLPKGHTRIVDGKIVSMSTGRTLCVWVCCLVRAGVALTLLVSGVMWLSSTSSKPDLILNAAALSFLMDLDEVLFETIVPAVVKRFVAQLQPLHCPSLKCYAEAVIPLLMACTIVIATLAGLVLPIAEDMLAVKRALCGAKVDFAMGMGKAGLVVIKNTSSYDASGGLELLQVRAVREFMTLPSGVLPAFSIATDSEWSFQRYSELNLEMMGDTTPICADLDLFASGVTQAEMQSWWTSIRDGAGALQDVGLPFRCADYARHCDTLPLLRSRCSQTCGCGDARSGLALAQAKQGCPGLCVRKAWAAVANDTCEDRDVRNSPAWRRYWTGFVATVADFFPSQRQGLLGLMERKLALGCASTERDPVFGSLACSEGDVPLQLGGLRSIVAFCPSLCCRNQPSPSAQCPASCAAA